MYEFKIVPESPNLVIIGNIAYDIIDFGKVDKQRENIINVGGACVFSTIPASLFYKVGMVGKIGKDFDISQFYGYNIDLSGVKTLDMPTTKFYTLWNTSDGQDRTIFGKVQKEMEIGSEDIPKQFLKAKHFHLTTARPEKQLEIVDFLRSKTNATISVDTIDDFVNEPSCQKVFDSVDLAFIDKEFTNLLNCKATKKVIKCGKTGCIFCSKDKCFSVSSKILENVVDKTGAGDCLNGVFVNLIANGFSEEKALKIAVDMATESVKHKGIMNLKLNNEILEREERG